MTTRPEAASADGDAPVAVTIHHFINPRLAKMIADVRSTAARMAGAKTSGSDTNDVDAVHDFRVALRRLRTLLRLVRQTGDSPRRKHRKRMRAIEERMKDYADTAGALRDEEVLRETLGGLDLEAGAREALTTWMAQRARQENRERRRVSAIVAEGTLRSTQKGDSKKSDSNERLHDVLLELERALASRPGRPSDPPRAFALRALEDAVRGVNEHATTDPRDIAGMHTLRIRFKRLRYAAEFFGALVDWNQEGTRAATRMQRRLGELHDLDEAILRMSRAWGLPSGPRTKVVSALRNRRAAAAEKAMTDLEASLAAIRRSELGCNATGTTPQRTPESQARTEQ